MGLLPRGLSGVLKENKARHAFRLACPAWGGREEGEGAYRVMLDGPGGAPSVAPCSGESPPRDPAIPLCSLPELAADQLAPRRAVEFLEAAHVGREPAVGHLPDHCRFDAAMLPREHVLHRRTRLQQVAALGGRGERRKG